MIDGVTSRSSKLLMCSLGASFTTASFRIVRVLPVEFIDRCGLSRLIFIAGNRVVEVMRGRLQD